MDVDEQIQKARARYESDTCRYIGFKLRGYDYMRPIVIFRQADEFIYVSMDTLEVIHGAETP